MSRIGKRELLIKENNNVTLENDILLVKGPKGELKLNIPNDVVVKIEDNIISVNSDKEEKDSMVGTINSHIENMLIGVSEGYQKGMEIVGVGYRFNVQGNTVNISAGYSHPVKLEVPTGLEVEGVSNTEIIIKGIDKQLVGEFAANIRKVRKPEPYKGKGIRYKGEIVRRKEGKKASK